MNNQNSGNTREFLGITQNDCKFQGKVVGDPIIQNDNYAFMKIKTSMYELGDNGQWADIILEIPVLTTDPKKVAVIQKYVQDGRELLIESFYKPWSNQGTPQHAFIIKKMSLGRKKYVPKDESFSQTPGLPVQ